MGGQHSTLTCVVLIITNDWKQRMVLSVHLTANVTFVYRGKCGPLSTAVEV